MAYTCYIKVDDQGSVTASLTSQFEPEENSGWIPLPREQQVLLGAGLNRLRYDEQTGISHKHRVRLSVGRMSFPADGETIVAIGVRDLPDPDVDVRVMINNQEHFTKPGEDLALSSETPGDFIVSVKDPYHYSVPGEVIINAFEPEENEL